MGAMTLLITGAGGFVGRHAVAEARARGHRVLALVRRAGAVQLGWQDDEGVTPVIADLAKPSAALNDAVASADAVIHAAASMEGARAETDTIEATRVLTAAVCSAEPVPALILVSSLSVYSGTALREGAVLTESSALEQEPDLRDAYCGAKLRQETLCREAMRGRGRLTILRPGAIWGAGRLWNGHLGQPLGPTLVLMEKAGQVPLCHVTRAAEALVSAAETAPRTEVFNILDDDLPNRARYVATLQAGGWPRFVLPFSWRILAGAARLAALVPGLPERLPGLLRRPVLAARMMPLGYDGRAGAEALRLRRQPVFDDLMSDALHGGARHG
ncbi:MAG: NAD(P)-dependent oxidoreductase [Paracoccaceae bacterium]